MTVSFFENLGSGYCLIQPEISRTDVQKKNNISRMKAHTANL